MVVTVMHPSQHEQPHSDRHLRSTTGGGGGNGAGGAGYLLEHLATFTVGEHTQIRGARDGMRQLLHMEKSTGIWTQKMQMQLAARCVVIVDYENGDLVERFPVELIREPTAFTSDDPKELYNNIFIFVVAQDADSNSSAPAEMHIFQCLHVTAQRVVEDTKAFISSGGVISGDVVDSPRSAPSPAPLQSTPAASDSGLSTRQQMALYNGRSNHFEVSRREVAGDTTPDDVSSTTSEKYERDVSVLNHCFDDIEKFIARLQQAAVAARELDKRRKKRQVKKKDLGDGMLSLRAKAPSTTAFVEILQKFKLSFNLLSKLKAHIHDPNAPELVHFLFTPLALIVDAARDCVGGGGVSGGGSAGYNLPADVLAPLLSREAVSLLANCLTSKETELWHSLGEAWCRSSEQWKGHVPVYQPVFLDGWAPQLHHRHHHHHSHHHHHQSAASSTAGSVVAASDTAHHPHHPHHHGARRSGGRYVQDGSEEPYYQSERVSQYPGGVGGGVVSPGVGGAGAHYYDDSDQASLPSPSLQAPSSAGGGSRHHHFKHHHHREGAGSSLSVVGGGGMGAVDGGVSPRDSYSGDSADSTVGRAPVVAASSTASASAAASFARQQRRWVDEVRSHGGRIVQVTYPRTANNDKELTVTRGEYLLVIDDSRKWWRVQNCRGQSGHVPHTIISAPASHLDHAQAVTASSDWSKTERQGNKGEFRYI